MNNHTLDMFILNDKNILDKFSSWDQKTKTWNYSSSSSTDNTKDDSSMALVFLDYDLPKWIGVVDAFYLNKDNAIVCCRLLNVQMTKESLDLKIKKDLFYRLEFEFDLDPANLLCLDRILKETLKLAFENKSEEAIILLLEQISKLEGAQ